MLNGARVLHKYISPVINWHTENPRNPVELKSPIHFLSRYFTQELYDKMAYCTNLYAVQNNETFHPTNSEELRTFVGLRVGETGAGCNRGKK